MKMDEDGQLAVRLVTTTDGYLPPLVSGEGHQQAPGTHKPCTLLLGRSGGKRKTHQASWVKLSKSAQWTCENGEMVESSIQPHHQPAVVVVSPNWFIDGTAPVD